MLLGNTLSLFCPAPADPADMPAVTLLVACCWLWGGPVLLWCLLLPAWVVNMPGGVVAATAAATLVVPLALLLHLLLLVLWTMPAAVTAAAVVPPSAAPVQP
jgi:hypothetical protein